MPKLACRVAALALFMAAAPGFGAMAQSAVAPPPAPAAAAPAIAPWGFDLSGADFTIRPGDNFFRYGDGRWYDRAVIPPDRSSDGVFASLSVTAEERVRGILERGADGVDSSVRTDAAKIGAFYAAFMNAARVEALDMQPIAPQIERLRRAGSYDEFAALMGNGSRSFFYSIFNMRIRPDDKAPDKYAVSIGQSGLGLNRDYYLTPALAEKKAAYLAYVRQILEMIGWEAPAQSADAVLAFETAIAEASWTNAQRRDPDKTYNPMSVAALAEVAPFPWRTLLASADLAQVDRVVVVENTAIPKIAAIYAKTPLATLKAWQAFHLADGAAPYLSKRFVEASFAFHSKTMGGVAQLPERWKRAVGTVNGAMGQAVGRVYVARYFPPEAKAQIDDLVSRLRVALKGRIERLDWMSDETKRKALDKLAHINVKIAYPEKWRDYSALEVERDDLVSDIEAARSFAWQRQVKRLNSPVDRDEWGMNPQTVNAYYSEHFNEIVFPAGILQPPFFDPAADPAVNFGGIGSVIGHELTHGFDDQGRKYDGSGALSDWWTAADAGEFNTRAAGLGRQYDSYEPFPGAHVKGDLTMGENIADLGGVLVALDAYHDYLGGKEAPVLDGFSGDQRFFLSYAQVWRDKATEASIRRQVVTNPHSPVEYRVNGVVRNVDAWYAAFDVKSGEKLYLAPADRVRIW
ncbi:MAG TPA: M13-type metalloendopeptidase [Xanthobacteraceae bacterium]|jgi:putative endopeptidase